MDSSEKIRAKLLESFAGIGTFVNKSNRKENSNVNHYLERYFTSIFQALYPDRKFKHLENEHTNAPKLDIVSEDGSFGIQVTVDSSLSKIESTLNDIKTYWPNLQILIILYPLPNKPKRRKKISVDSITILEWSFDEIEKEIWKTNDELPSKIYRLTASFFLNLSTTHIVLGNVESIDYNNFIQNLKHSEKYIPRKISEKVNISNSQNIQTSETLDFLLKNKRVILTGEPGLGKTSELIALSKKLAAKKIGYPIFLEFKDCFTNKEFEHYLPKDYKLLPLKKIVLIVDGFDEISIKEKTSMIRNFKSFLKSEPELMVVFSVRANFYSSILENVFEDFSEASLESLDWQDISYFVNTFFGIDGERFINSCYSHSLMELAENPYYLNLLATEYLKEDGLHGSSSEIIKKLFENRIEDDLNKHFCSSIPDKIAKDEIQGILEQISCIMTIGGFTQIPHDNIKKIVPPENLEVLKQLLIFKPSTIETKGQWQFEHNKLRDYLSARNLLTLEFSKIKKLVCIPNTNNIAPNWLDTLILLLNIISTSNAIFHPLFELVQENSNTAIFNIERGKIKPQLRFQILKQLVEYFKIRTIWINLKGISESRLAYFSQSEESFDFLLSQIGENSEHRRIRLSCLFILKEFKNLDKSQKEKIKASFFPIMEANLKDEYLSEYFIRSLASLKIIDLQTIDFVRKSYLQRNNQFIRGGMYEFIAVLENPDDWLDYLIEGIIVEKLNDFDRDGISNGSESINLETAFKSIQKLSSLEKILKEFLTNEYYEENYNFQKILETILLKSSDFYNDSENLFELIIELNFKLVTSLRYEYYEIFQEYFTRTKSFEKGLIKTIEKWKKKLDYEGKHEIAIIIHESSLISYNEYYLKGEISFEDSETIFFILRNLGNKFHEKFKENIESISGRSIEIPKPTDSKQIQFNKKRKDLEVWFNKDGLKNEILEIIARDEELSHKSLSKAIYEKPLTNANHLHLHHTAKKILREFLSNGVSSKLQISEWIDKEEEFENLLIHHIHDLIHRHDPFELLDKDQISYLFSWFERNINTVNFKSVRIFGENINMYILRRAKYLSYFYEIFDFPCSESKSLELLAFCNHTQGSYQTVTISTIIHRIGKNKVEDQIEKNILEGKIQNSMAMSTHFNYAFKNKKEHLFNPIFEHLTKENLNDKTRLADLNEFFISKNDPIFLYTYFQKFSENDQLFILEQIHDDHLNSDLELFLEKIIQQDNSVEIERAINSLLLRLGKIEGLKNSIEWIKKNKVNPFNYKHFELVNYKSLDALPYLLELLILSYDKEITNNVRIDTIWGKVRTALIELAKKSNSFAQTIISEMEKTIKENPRAIEDMGHNYEIIEDIKNDLLHESLKTKPLSIKECIKIYNKVFG